MTDIDLIGSKSVAQYIEHSGLTHFISSRISSQKNSAPIYEFLIGNSNTKCVEAFNKWNQHQTKWNHGLQCDTKQFIWYHSENLKNWIEIPLRQDFKGGGKWIGFVAKHCWIKHCKGNNAADSAKNYNRENI